MRRVNRIGRTRAFIGIEQLEGRRHLSGVVKSTLGSDGTLLIKGDGGDNQIEIAGSPGAITITPAGPTFVTFPNVFPASAVFAIKVELGDGNDFAEIHDLTAANGIHLMGPTGLKVTDDKGFDSYSLHDIDIAAPITVATGQSSDSVGLQTVDSSALTITTTGNDFTFDSLSLNAVTTGSTVITSGSSIDFINIENSIFRGTLTMKTGDGNDQINVSANDNGSFVSVTGDFTLDAGNDNDNITFGNDGSGGGGGGSVFVSSNLNLKAGGGFDMVSMTNTFAANVGGGTSLVDGGSGNDLLHDGGNNFGWAFVNFEGFF
jgi:hypothetical protein